MNMMITNEKDINKMALWELERKGCRYADIVMSMWNKYVAVPYGLRKVKVMTLQRRSKVCELSGYFGLSEIRSAIKEIGKSEWLHSQPWFTLDWLLDIEHFTKVIEGYYSKETTTRTNQYTGGSHIVNERIEL